MFLRRNTYLILSVKYIELSLIALLKEKYPLLLNYLNEPEELIISKRILTDSGKAGEIS
ncbi:Uncharacterised protein [[Flavobacterium] thermophilum]|jgi:hypothetical protein|nr:Uncharacterised protein [[Flavobacterium] thermophilum]